MVGHGRSCSSSYLTDPTSPISSHSAVIILFKSVPSIVATSTLRVNTSSFHGYKIFRVVKTTASKGHQMHCSWSGGHSSNPGRVELGLVSTFVQVVLEPKIYVWNTLRLASLSNAQCSLPVAALELAPDSELTRVLYEIPRFQVEQVIGWNLIPCTWHSLGRLIG